jgi:hypothetical protein
MEGAMKPNMRKWLVSAALIAVALGVASMVPSSLGPVSPTPAETAHIVHVRSDIESDTRLEGAIIKFGGERYGIVSHVDTAMGRPVSLTVVFPNEKVGLGTIYSYVIPAKDDWMLEIEKIIRTFDPDYPVMREMLLPAATLKSVYTR